MALRSCQEGPEYFSAKVSRAKVSDWLRQGSKQPAFQAELLPVMVEAATWEQEIHDRDVLLFLDNEAARYAMVKGYTPVASAARLVGEAWLQLAACGASAWVARVPSGSNPADAPSRLQTCPVWKEVSAALPALSSL